MRNVLFSPFISSFVKKMSPFDCVLETIPGPSHSFFSLIFASFTGFLSFSTAWHIPSLYKQIAIQIDQNLILCSSNHGWFHELTVSSLFSFPLCSSSLVSCNSIVESFIWKQMQCFLSCSLIPGFSSRQTASSQYQRSVLSEYSLTFFLHEVRSLLWKEWKSQKSKGEDDSSQQWQKKRRDTRSTDKKRETTWDESQRY